MRRLQKQSNSRILIFLFALLCSCLTRYAFAAGAPIAATPQFPPGADCTTTFTARPDILTAFQSANGGQPINSQPWASNVEFDGVQGAVHFSFVKGPGNSVAVQMKDLAPGLNAEVMKTAGSFFGPAVLKLLASPQPAYLCTSPTGDPAHPRLFVDIVSQAYGGTVDLIPATAVGTQAQLVGTVQGVNNSFQFTFENTNSVQ